MWSGFTVVGRDIRLFARNLRLNISNLRSFAPDIRSFIADSQLRGRNSPSFIDGSLLFGGTSSSRNLLIDVRIMSIRSVVMAYRDGQTDLERRTLAYLRRNLDRSIVLLDNPE